MTKTREKVINILIDNSDKYISGEYMSDILGLSRASVWKHIKALGHGQGYKYPHAYQDHYVDQQYLPDNMVDKVYYEPQANKFEGQIRDFMNYLKGKKAE